jgi:biopolymer transport protein TolR
MGITLEPAPKGKPKGAKPDINITPLVDVVLVLLIIFMVVAPQLEAGEEVQTPTIENPDPKAKGKLDPLTVTYTLSGKWFVEKDPFVDLDAFKARLAQEHSAHPERRVVLKGDHRQTYGKMRELFATLQTIGFPGISLVVGEKPKKGGAASPVVAE